MKDEYTRETFLRAYSELLQAAENLGISAEVGKMIAGQLRSEGAIRRMTSYLLKAKPRTMEDIADEMLAIQEDRRRWAEKKQAQESNAAYTAWLNSDYRESGD